jgi:nucleotide-binding universal stress UspA family protein
LRIPTSSPVVVGVSGTAAGLAAVRLGAREAVSRGRQLRIVHAFTWPGPSMDGYDEARQTASRILEEATATAQRSTPGVQVTPQLADGVADRVLIQLSRTAEMVILGDDDIGGTPWLPVGSVLVQTAARAFCPVVVARGPRPPTGPVVVAVDGSLWSVQALRHAALEARRLGVTAEVVHVVEQAGLRAEDEGRRVLAATVAAVRGLGRTRPRLMTGDPGPALARVSTRARMIVLGPRGTEGSALLGSVARRLLHHGACPTVFVHGPARPEQRAGNRAGRASGALAR